MEFGKLGASQKCGNLLGLTRQQSYGEAEGRQKEINSFLTYKPAVRRMVASKTEPLQAATSIQ